MVLHHPNETKENLAVYEQCKPDDHNNNSSNNIFNHKFMGNIRAKNNVNWRLLDIFSNFSLLITLYELPAVQHLLQKSDILEPTKPKDQEIILACQKGNIW